MRRLTGEVTLPTPAGLPPMSRHSRSEWSRFLALADARSGEGAVERIREVGLGDTLAPTALIEDLSALNAPTWLPFTQVGHSIGAVVGESAGIAFRAGPRGSWLRTFFTNAAGRLTEFQLRDADPTFLAVPVTPSYVPLAPLLSNTYREGTATAGEVAALATNPRFFPLYPGPNVLDYFVPPGKFGCLFCLIANAQLDGSIVVEDVPDLRP